MIRGRTPAPGRRVLSFVVGLAALFAVSVRAEDEPNANSEATDADERVAQFSATLDVASAAGKYRMLLRQFKVEADRETVGDFKDDGLQNRAEYTGETNLPRGYWVYAFPYWYIWRDRVERPLPQREWGPEQLIGEPNTLAAGDIVTAWASLSQDGQEEWLLLEYAEPVMPLAVQIHETYNPGAVNKVAVLGPDGIEETVWTGEDPTPTNAEKGVSVIPFKTSFPVNRVKVYLDSANNPGWNEIDAVGLRNVDGQTHWVAVAQASSTYAEQSPANPFTRPVPTQELQQRISQLEQEVAELKKVATEVNKLRQSIEELKRLLERKGNP